MATHSSILAWKIPWTVEPGRLQSMGSQSETRLNDLACTFTWWSFVVILQFLIIWYNDDYYDEDN